MDDLRQVMKINFETNYCKSPYSFSFPRSTPPQHLAHPSSQSAAYRATIPYLLDQNPRSCTWTICTGSQGDIGERALPAMSQGAVFSMCNAACRSLAETNIRFNEVYLALDVEFDADAEAHGVMKASVFGRVYEKVLDDEAVKGCRVRVENDRDVDKLRYEGKL